MNRPRSIGFLALSSIFLPSLCAGAEWTGSKACAKCHSEIYRRYATTPMALTSGLAIAAEVPDQSFATNAGYRYSIVHQDGKLFLEFRGPTVKNEERRELAYFVGSGAAARSYLMATDNFLYEAPATYYSSPRSWALSPGYGRYDYPFLTRAIAPGCLQCHATGVQAISGTQNGYRSPPFTEGGVGCERCHGPGAAHVLSGEAADILNPASLPPEQRDSVCAQCHLSGDIRVDRAGKSITDFNAGDKLSDYSIAFVRSTVSGTAKVTSHVENLAQSACSRGSGTHFWCGTCHDPHFVPSASEKAAWFRSKCETCHTPQECRRGPDCVGCHMPRSSVSDAEHVVFTDHSIPRRPAPRNSARADASLVAFGREKSTPREQGLAYAIVALREQNRAYSARAFELLKGANRVNPNDPQTLSYLADLYKGRNDNVNAIRLYRRLYAADPTQSSAPMNLGAWEMEQGHNVEAIGFFEEALRISPALVLVRMNLAVAMIRTGRTAQARSVLETALRFNPSFKAARDLLAQIQ